MRVITSSRMAPLRPIAASVFFLGMNACLSTTHVSSVNAISAAQTDEGLGQTSTPPNATLPPAVDLAASQWTTFAQDAGTSEPYSLFPTASGSLLLFEDTFVQTANGSGQVTTVRTGGVQGPFSTVDVPTTDLTGNPFSTYYVGPTAEENGLIFSQGSVIPTTPTGLGASTEVLRVSRDGGNTWSVTDQVTPITVPGVTLASINAGIGVKPTLQAYSDGTIYHLASVMVGTASGWVLRGSLDGGATWKTLDVFTVASPVVLNPWSVRRGTSGSIYVAGFEISGTNVSTMLRTSADGGKTWASQQGLPSPLIAANGQCLDVDLQGRLFEGQISAVNQITVRSSDDGGTAWTVADAFMGDAGIAASMGNVQNLSLLVSPSGYPYVGFFQSSFSVSGKTQMVVRASADRGATWQMLDDSVLDGEMEFRGLYFSPNSAKIYTMFQQDRAAGAALIRSY